MFKFATVTVTVVFGLFCSMASIAQAASYAGQEQRAIKALSPDEVESYLQGKGAGLAKAAELNHYPGPSHVLELAEKLQLDPQQKQRTQALFKAMQAEAIKWGKALIDKEQELDRQFAQGNMSSTRLRSLLDQIGKLQAEVRRAHLQAHLDQKVILTPAQVAQYDVLRGYTTGKAHSHSHH